MSLLSAKDTAKILGISYAQLLEMRKRGEGPRYTMVGCLIKYVPADVKEWIDENASTKK